MKLGTSKTKNVYVIETKGGKSFDPKYQESYIVVYNNAILWNADYGIKTNNGTCLSPATGFSHECAHAWDYFTDSNYENNSKEDKNNPYDSIEEENVITGDEQRQAEANGETPKGRPTRTDHEGTPCLVNDPTEKPVDEH